MNDLAIYLNDHLAGSVGALDMLDDMIDAHKKGALEPFLKSLCADIESDQRELKDLMKHLGIKESMVRRAGAWVAEKLSRPKLRVGDVGEANLALLQSFESLSLGIAGKRSLWQTLTAAAASSSIDGLDLARLEKRATEQFERVEGKVREVAVAIFDLGAARDGAPRSKISARRTSAKRNATAT